MTTKRGLGFLVLSALLSVTPLSVFFATGLALIARKQLSGQIYYGALVLALGSCWILLDLKYWGAFLVVSLLGGTFAEAQIRGWRYLAGGLFAVVSTASLSGLGIFWWAQSQQVDLLARLRTTIETQLANLSAHNQAFGIGVDSLMQQLPSVVVAMMILALWLALLFENFVRRAGWLGPLASGEVTEDLTSFRLPELSIWFSLAIIALAFIEIPWSLVKLLAENFFNVAVVVYFLQGLAVVASFFRHHRVSSFWQILWYFMVLQMHLVVAVVGFSDYWLDFRKRFLSSGQEIKERKSEEDR